MNYHPNQRFVTLYNEVADLFTLGIVNVRELRSVANALQERRFSSIRSANDKDSETTNAIEVLFDFSRSQRSAAWGKTTACAMRMQAQWISSVLEDRLD